MWGLSGIYCLDKRLWFYSIGRCNIEDDFQFWCHVNLIFCSLNCVLNLLLSTSYGPVKDQGWRRMVECKAATRASELCAIFVCFEVSMVGVRTGECTDTVQTLYRYCTSVPPGPRLQTPGRNHLFRGDLATAVCCHCQHCARQMTTSPCALLSASSQHALVTRQGCW